MTRGVELVARDVALQAAEAPRDRQREDRRGDAALEARDGVVWRDHRAAPGRYQAHRQVA